MYFGMNMGPMPPAFHWAHALTQWHFAVLPTVLLVVALEMYWIGTRRLAAWSPWRTAAFAGGCVATFLATESVLGVYDMVLFSAHMVQHLILIMLAGPLFALSAPLDLAVSSLRGKTQTWLSTFVNGRSGALLFHPVTCFGAYAAFIPVTHLSGLMNLMMEHEWIHHLEQVAFIAVGYLFFRAVFGLEHGSHSLHPGLRLVYLMAAVPVDTFTGLALMMSTRNPFPVYEHMKRTWGPTVLSDVRLGGAVMWIGGDALMLLAMIPAAVLWLRFEDQRTLELDARLDAEAALQSQASVESG
jgi:cytochrome c oxidase assembly factor CtaG